MQNLNAEVISIGTEILLGEIVDTNSAYIAQILRDLGINLYFMASVGDNEQRIAEAIRIALSRAHIVITCGGLGPTVDDMTRQAVALATERELVFHQELLDQIASRFTSFRVKMTENNRRQAFLPEEAIVVENPVGTAPCFIVKHEGHIVASLPGVPREMKFLLNTKIVPYLSQRYSLGVIKAHILRTAGIGESTLDDLIGTALLQQSNPTVGLAAHQGQVDIRITAKADTLAEAERMISEVEIQLRERIGRYIFGTDTDTLESVLVELLYAHQAKIAISETGIGNTVSASIRSIERGEQVIASTQTYPDPESLQHALGAEDKILIQDLAMQVAKTIALEAKAMVGLAVVCHPDIDENADNEQGTAVAVYTQENIRSRVYGFGGKSELARAWVAGWTMSAAWRMLKEKYEA